MTLDRSLRSLSGLSGTRSVLSRAERIAHMAEEGKFDVSKDCPLGLPKTKVKRSHVGKAKKTEEAAEGEAPAAGASAAAAGTKAAAPAAGGKAAPAAKAAAPAKGDKKK